ncbi:hypothetical protein BT67DRAFT_7865 [Trichocladium antarcticum]|uniref:Uncharacterized protein n=1 Tax=Trichocladium antarcticum TaxID=1450529 RepID=A0AAN6USF2_9PEZI|nr:hypothetical protein BT67DRAFT_7865 [Trichocladium antarcticum]
MQARLTSTAFAVFHGFSTPRIVIRHRAKIAAQNMGGAYPTRHFAHCSSNQKKSLFFRSRLGSGSVVIIGHCWEQNSNLIITVHDVMSKRNPRLHDPWPPASNSIASQATGPCTSVPGDSQGLFTSSENDGDRRVLPMHPSKN